MIFQRLKEEPRVKQKVIDEPSALCDIFSERDLVIISFRGLLP